MREWSVKYPGCENLNIAVMGCVVNGPGESEQADIGISLPGNGESRLHLFLLMVSEGQPSRVKIS